MPISVFLTVISIHALAVISPGPDTLLIFKNSLNSNRYTSLVTALGITAANGTYILLTAFGFGVMSTQYPTAFTLLKISGSVFLIYLGISGLFSSKLRRTIEGNKVFDNNIHKSNVLTHKEYLHSFSEGYLSTITNAKAALYFLSFTTQFINGANSFTVNFIFATSMLLITFTWFSGLAICIQNHYVQSLLSKHANKVSILLSLLFIFLGASIALETLNEI